MLGIFEILDLVERASSKKEKIDLLRHFKSTALLTILQGAFDSRVVWDLPEGPVEFTAAPGAGMETILYKQSQSLYMYAKNAVPGLTDLKRQTLFVQLLESVHPRDANILLHAKDKKLPYKTISPEIVAEAFPELQIIPVKFVAPVEVDKSETSFPTDEKPTSSKNRQRTGKPKKKNNVQSVDKVQDSTSEQTKSPEEYKYVEDEEIIAKGLINPEDQQKGTTEET